MRETQPRQTVLITGGGKGIGREIAYLFGKTGYNVTITGREEKTLKSTAGRLSEGQIHVLPLVGDVTSIADCQNVIDHTLRHYGRIDVLINNAGMTMRGLFEHTDLSVFQKIMDINFGGAVTMTKLALPHLKPHKGSVVFISSIAGLKGLPGSAPYSASKMALTSLAESLRCELRGQVHIGVLFVSFTENDPNKIMLNASGELVPLIRDKYSSSQEDVARAALRLVRRRKRQIIMTPLGKVANFLYKVFPALSERTIAVYAPRSSMYAVDNLFK